MATLDGVSRHPLRPFAADFFRGTVKQLTALIESLSRKRLFGRLFESTSPVGTPDHPLGAIELVCRSSHYNGRLSMT